VAHAEGNYVCDDETFDELVREDRVVFRYCDPAGESGELSNINGSRDHIAGICSRGRNVLGMMPHPERCSETILGNAAGLKVFQSIAASFARA
jgi:phosphoribosylformylglycinamidine synthase